MSQTRPITTNVTTGRPHPPPSPWPVGPFRDGRQGRHQADVVAAEAGAGRPAVIATEAEADDKTGLPEVVAWPAVVAAADKAGRPDINVPEEGAGRRTCT